MAVAAPGHAGHRPGPPGSPGRARRPGPGRPRRGPIALGVLAFWELHRYSAVPRLAGGTLGIDPVLAVAPVLALAGIALLPLRVLPPPRGCWTG